MMNDKQQNPEQRKQPFDQNEKPAVKDPGSEDKKPLEGPDFDVRHDKINPTAQADRQSNVEACGTKACGTKADSTDANTLKH